MATSDELKEKLSANLKKIALGGGVLLLVFLLGLLPGWLKASEARTQQAQAERQAQELRARLEAKLELTQMLGQLGMASYEVNRNNYANAAQHPGRFFDQLRELSRAARMRRSSHVGKRCWRRVMRSPPSWRQPIRR